VLSGDNLPVLALSVTLSLWAAAGGMRAIMVTLNRAYDVPEGRPLWWRQLLALLLTVALGISLAIAFPALSFSARIGARIGAVLGAESAALWRFGVRLVVVGLLLFGVETVYHFAPNARRPWRWLTPGSLLAVVLWIPATTLFALYVSRFARYETLYAGLGAPVVLLLWFYLTGFAILLGGEMNAEIDKEIGIHPRVAVPAPAGADAAGYTPADRDSAARLPVPPSTSTVRRRSARRGGRSAS
jgi:membrane protein